jgi:hypothetical protein
MTMSEALSRGLRSDIDGRFRESVMPIRSIRARATAEAMLPERFVQLFFGAQSGVPNADFVRCKCRRECCREAVHAIADQDLRTAEVTISQAFP